jgi:hypothetical protein
MMVNDFIGLLETTQVGEMWKVIEIRLGQSQT